MRGSQSRSAGGAGETSLQQPHCCDPQHPRKAGWAWWARLHICHLQKNSPMLAAERQGIPAGLDFYCGLVVVVGLRAAHCSQSTQRSDPILTVVLNVVAGDHSSFLTISAPYSEF